MPRTKHYKKNIACLESFWDGHLDSPLRVLPILEIASRLNEVRFAHLTCNTQEELAFNLKLIRRRRGYGILYFSFHGFPGQIQLASGCVTLEHLAELMGKGFRNWVVHFGSCSVVHIPKKRLDEFIHTTGVSLLLGYRKDPDWADGTALDLLILDWLHSFKDMCSFWKNFSSTYTGLIRRTGLRAYLR